MNPIINLTLRVNGEDKTAPIEPRTSLADFLRDHCGQTGTHLGCEHGVCGACTVTANGIAVRSCITLAAVCEGLPIETVQGLDDDPIMQIIQQAFHECHGLQCGFCTPGMLMTVRDMLIRGVADNEQSIRRELNGNLCRCTGYGGIVRAVKLAAERYKTN